MTPQSSRCDPNTIHKVRSSFARRSRVVRASFAIRSPIVRGSVADRIRESDGDDGIGDAVLWSSAASRIVKNCTQYTLVQFRTGRRRAVIRSANRAWFARPRHSRMVLRRNSGECAPNDAPVIAMRSEQHPRHFRRISPFPSIAPLLSVAMLPRDRSRVRRGVAPTFAWSRRII